MYLTNPNGSLKLDSLGRRRHVNSCAGFKYNGNRKGRPSGTGEGLKYRLVLSMSKEMCSSLIKKAKTRGVSRSELIRTYVEWGLEQC